MRTLSTLAALVLLTTTTVVSGQQATMTHDPDKNPKGSGVPAGFMGRVDRANAKLQDAKYTKMGNKWEIKTGPAHIIYSPKHTGSGLYSAAATFELLEAPAHPEAFGIFIGGQDLDKPTQRYTYFVVRPTGEFLIKTRTGDSTKNVVAWKADAAVPKVDASGKATYEMMIHVAADDVHFILNGKPVAAVPKSQIFTEGVAGLRVNHNLHVKASPISISGT